LPFGDVASGKGGSISPEWGVSLSWINGISITCRSSHWKMSSFMARRTVVSHEQKWPWGAAYISSQGRGNQVAYFDLLPGTY